jgi:small subunit ribosomal protein S9
MKISLKEKKRKMPKRDKKEKNKNQSQSVLKKGDFVFAVGRRKTAVARVRLFKGKGEILVNDQPINKYFSNQQAELFYLKPFQVTDTLGKFHATIKVEGSGLSGQLGAVVHGLARALDKLDKEAYHTALKKNKLLTRDPRAKERRKVGQMGKARKKKQSPKR